MAGLGFLYGAYQKFLSGLQRAGHFAGRHVGKALKPWWAHMLFVLALWGLCLYRLDRHGPQFVRSRLILLPEEVTAWQTFLTLLLLFFVCRILANAMSDLGVYSPELVDKLYSPSFFQATELTTALDAGFWTAMAFKKAWLRDIASLVFSIYYALVPAQAHEKVRRVRAVATVDHLRVSWDKSTTPYLQGLSALLRPKLTKHGPREIHIHRPNGSPYNEPVRAWLYFDGSLDELKQQICMVLDIPGGGFVAMNPRTADDRLLAWADKTKLPILSLDYKKAPEYPYPHALNECYDVYRTIVQTRGACFGLDGDVLPRIAVSGDSAGGNLATSMVLKILSSTALPEPHGLVLAYPCLNMKVEAWMTPDQVSLVGNTLSGSSEQSHSQNSIHPNPQAQDFHGGIVVSSMISFMDDRMLTPDTMRALVLLYIGSGNNADFAHDYLLSPVLGPSSLLARFPKTFIITGERDPMVDDTVIFAGRLRQAKFQQTDSGTRNQFNPLDHVDVSLVRGVSHGFLQMAGFWPEGWTYVFQTAQWISELLQQQPVFVNEGGMEGLVGEEELLGRRMKFLGGGLV